MFVIYADLKVGGMTMMIYMGVCEVANGAAVRSVQNALLIK